MKITSRPGCTRGRGFPTGVFPIRLLTVIALGAAVGCRSDAPATDKRVIVLGFDGMDYALTERLMSEGRLTNLARLAREGGFSSLRTSIPPQSPVAWSEFITGLDAGGHGIFDFMHRDPETMVPYLSTTKTEEPSRIIKVGRWQLPLSGGRIQLLRYGTPFWEVLEEHGVPTTIVRIPANFPPSGSASRELSGMGTPDILGTYGTFSFFTTAPERIAVTIAGGGVIYPAEVSDHVFRGSLRGPAHPFLREQKNLEAEFTVYIDPTRPVAKIVLGEQEVVLQEGEWSEWLTAEFKLLGFLKSLRGTCRIYLKEVRPEFQLYVTPINLDPLDSAMPISTPHDFAAELTAATGRYYTQGMAEDTRALTAGVFDDEEFLVQAAMVAAENHGQYRHVLESFEGGLLFYYFGHLDMVSHVMWRAMDPSHPAHDSVADRPYRNVIEDLYVEADEIVGETLEHIDDDTMLIVMSDHGFASWRRAFNLNTWLKENGYLALEDPSQQGESELFANVDWSRTQAYALGLNGLYINLRGRERFGIVPRRGQRALIIDEIARGLLKVADPKTGELAIASVYRRDQIYADTGHRDIGPDLIIGYAAGYRSSDESAIGRIPHAIFYDNTSKWSATHEIDRNVVPGVLFTSHPLRREVASLRDVAAVVLAEFGIERFPRDNDAASAGK
jgi:predicted AlkP superfamily phosphohydrolase/phosphomutase